MDTVGRQTTMRFTQFTFGNDNVIGLRVTDSRNNTNEMTATVAVTEGNRSPAANAGGFRDADGAVVGPYAIAVGESLTLNSDGTSDPDSACGDAVVALSWDLDRNGVEDANEAAPSSLGRNSTTSELMGLVSTKFSSPRRTALSNRHGDSTTLVVDGPNAVATATPNRTGCSNNVTFSGSNSTVNGPGARASLLNGTNGISTGMASTTTQPVRTSREQRWLYQTITTRSSCRRHCALLTRRGEPERRPLRSPSTHRMYHPSRTQAAHTPPARPTTAFGRPTGRTWIERSERTLR